MTRAELVELLQVERFLPLPPAPKPGAPYDTAKQQHSRRVELMAEVDEFDRYARKDGPRLVKKGLIHVAERTAA